MKFKGLSVRLQAAFDLALPNLDFWDVGCDHGQLGTFALKSKKFRSVSFVDPAKHRIEFLQQRTFEKNARFFPFELQAVQEKIEGNLFFLGVGGTTIKNALLQAQNLWSSRLILGPQKDLEEIENLQLPHYQLVGKHSVVERGRTRQLYVFERIASTSNELS